MMPARGAFSGSRWPMRGRGYGLLASLAVVVLLLGACGSSAVAPSSAVQEPTAVVATATKAVAPTSAAAPTSIPAASPTVLPATIPPQSAPTIAATSAPTAPPVPAAQPTATPRAPTATAAAAVPPPAATIIVPAAKPTPQARPVPINDGPDVPSEVRAFFNAFYKARTLARGGTFDFPATLGLTASPYQEYTTTLLQRDADDAAAGKLLSVSYSGIAVQLDTWQGSGGVGTAQASVTRTLTTVTSGGAQAPQTATYQFRLRRAQVDPTHATWVAYDFFNPGANAWVSSLETQGTTASIGGEVSAFFTNFYALREVAPGGKLDIDRNAELTAFAYREYTVPILQQQQGEIARKQLSSIRYTDIAVKVVSWDNTATDHGGIATVAVTRTARVVRPSGAEAPQTATYQFRLHRHTDESGKGYWLAVDFFNPAVGRWVSESAGQPWVVPPSGYG